MGTTNDRPRHIKRRTLVAGTAWAVPTLAVASPALAYTQSGNFVSGSGTAFKLQGNSCGSGYLKQGYRFYFTITNPPGFGATVVFQSVTVAGISVPYQLRVDDRAQCGNNVTGSANKATCTTPCTCPTGSTLPQVCVAPSKSILVAIDGDFASSSTAVEMCITYQVYQGTPCDCTKSFPAVTLCTTANVCTWNYGDCWPFNSVSPAPVGTCTGLAAATTC